MSNLFLVVTVGPDYRLLHKFLRYYKNLGIKNFLVILNTQDSAPIKVLHEYGIISVRSWTEPFSEQLKQYHERKILIEHCSVNDWVIYADLDEFQVYPRGLSSHISECEKYGIDFLEGKLIDRISSTGKLLKLDVEIPLEDQFPLEGLITSKLLKAWDKKIVLAKGNLIVGGGHHIFLDGTTNKTLPYKSKLNKYSAGIQIHHFKWDRDVLSRMNRYLQLQDKSLLFWREEISRFLNHYSRYNRIDISDKKLRVKMVHFLINI